MAADISPGLQAWLAARRLGELADGLAKAGFTEVESLLEVEEVALQTAVSKLGFDTAGCKRLVAEVEALRRPPLPGPLRERILELSPCQLMRLAAVLETATKDSNGSTNEFIMDQHRVRLRPVPRLSARLDARRWQGLGCESEPRRWRVHLTEGQVQPILLPHFASFDCKAAAVLMSVGQDDGPWVPREQWEPLVSKALQNSPKVKMQLMVITGTASLTCDPEGDNVDLEAMALAQEHGFSSFVDRVVLGLHGTLELTAGEMRCKLSLGPPNAAKVYGSRGKDMEAMLDGVVQVARTTSRTFSRHWQVLQIMSDTLSSLRDMAGIKKSPSKRILTTDNDALEDDVEILQLFSISLTGKFSGAIQEEDKSDIEVGFNEMATGMDDDTGKQVRAVVQSLASDFAFLHLALFSPELAEVERRLVYREGKGVAGAEKAAQETAKAKPVDLRRSLGLSLSPEPEGASTPTTGMSPEPPDSPKPGYVAPRNLRDMFGLQDAVEPATPTLAPKQAKVKRGSTVTGVPTSASGRNFAETRRSATETINATSNRSAGSTAIPKESKLTSRFATDPAKIRGLPPIDTGVKKENLKAKEKEAENELARKPLPGKDQLEILRLAKLIFSKVDFDNAGSISAPKFNWGFKSVAPIFEVACPGFGPSAFESSEVDGNNSRSYFAFLDENTDETIDEDEFVKHFATAAELRPTGSKVLVDAMQECDVQLEKLRNGGAILCSAAGSVQGVTVTGGQQMELLYSVLPDKIAKIQSALKCSTPLGSSALVVLLPGLKVITSLEKALTDAICVVMLDPSFSAGHVNLAVPPSCPSVRDGVIRMYCGAQVGSGFNFIQVGGDLQCTVQGAISVLTMGANINAALENSSAEDGSSLATHMRREKTQALLEKISRQELKPDLTVSVRRELLPRLAQVLLSAKILSEKDLVPLAPSMPKVTNAGRGGILSAEEGPTIAWRIADPSHAYLLILVPVAGINNPKPTGAATVCYTLRLEGVEQRLVEGSNHACKTLKDIRPGHFLTYVKAKGKPGWGEWSRSAYFRTVSKPEVKEIETDLKKISKGQDVVRLRQSICMAETIWLVDQSLITSSHNRLVAMEHESRILTALTMDDAEHLSRLLDNARKVVGISQEVLDDAQKYVCSLYAKDLRNVLDLEGTDVESLQKIASALKRMPNHGESDLIQEAEQRIQAMKVEPDLQAAIENTDLDDLIYQFNRADPLIEACGKRWHGMLDQGRGRLQTLAEERLQTASTSDDIEVVTGALHVAGKAAELMAVKRRGASNTWFATTHAINPVLLGDAKKNFEALKYQKDELEAHRLAVEAADAEARAVEEELEREDEEAARAALGEEVLDDAGYVQTCDDLWAALGMDADDGEKEAAEKPVEPDQPG